MALAGHQIHGWTYTPNLFRGDMKIRFGCHWQVLVTMAIWGLACENETPRIVV